jgi:hypothetical protein
MFIRYLLIIFSFLGLFFDGFNIYADDTDQIENPDEISDYSKELIEKGELRPLSLLETIDIEKFNIVTEYISRFDHSRDDNIDDYYFGTYTSIIIALDEMTKRYLTIDEYNEIINLPEYKDCEIEYYIVYGIYYYERFLNKYRSYRGDPTGKCFTVFFNKDHEFVRIVRTR